MNMIMIKSPSSPRFKPLNHINRLVLNVLGALGHWHFCLCQVNTVQWFGPSEKGTEAEWLGEENDQHFLDALQETPVIAMRKI